MDYTTLNHLRNNHPAWRLLRSEHAPLVASFLRRVFVAPNVRMLACKSVWGEEEKQTLRDLPRLRPDELALYEDLRDNRIRKNLRLEQEQIGFDWVNLALAKL